ncbi:lipopolysaccharide kinase InaA family protein [Gramella sp. KN1008]|uniref:lipopolysaccharide kinase InaA family protein n=1 Tax=Gramella sp. KN1008 TaxID=2529298 RepID=UPI00103F1FC0|nr:lipopolysaccharide kinase InaA family protein [Gramella sp. KN1008]TBW28454.1 Kdo domain containing protein [Gramella sp. KN1008]
MKATWNQEYVSKKNRITHCIENFSSEGNILYDGRNTIKTFEIDSLRINIKSFRIPNLINKIAYRFFRKSKAERSFAYANMLKEKGIGTPDPIAYFEEQSGLTFKRSFYVSRQVEYDLTFRELVDDPDYPRHEEILRAFTRFTYSLHENDVLFLDHSPGNTLIQINKGDYKFYLVDLNRMVFKELTDTERFLNFSRLTPKREMVEIMADEYAKLIGGSSSEVFAKMWFFTDKFQKKYWKKQKIKRFLKPKKN